MPAVSDFDPLVRDPCEHDELEPLYGRKRAMLYRRFEIQTGNSSSSLLIRGSRDQKIWHVDIIDYRSQGTGTSEVHVLCTLCVPDRTMIGSLTELTSVCSSWISYATFSTLISDASASSFPSLLAYAQGPCRAPLVPIPSKSSLYIGGRCCM